MHFVLIVAVLMLVAASQSAGPEPVGDASLRILAVAGSCLALGLLATWMSHRTVILLQRRPMASLETLRRFSRFKTLHLGLVLVNLLVLVAGLRWAHVVQGDLGLWGAVLVDDLLIMAPLVIPLMLAWGAFFDVEQALQGFGAPPGKSGGPASAWGDGGALRMGERCAFVGMYARHYLGLVLAPVFFLLLVKDLVEWLNPNWLSDDRGFLLYGPLLLVIALALPWLLSRIWRTEPLPRGPLRDELEQIALRAGVRLRDILVWKTDGHMVNAAVAGFTPWLRYVFLTDGLLSQLSTLEVAAVVRHEVAHVRRRHVMLRVLVLAVPLAAWTAVQAWWPGVDQAIESWLATLGGPMTWQSALLAPAIVALYAFTMLGWLARQLEHDADAWAGAQPVLAAEPSGRAAEHLISALHKLAPHPSDRRRASWLHPSIDARCRLLQDIAARPEAADRLHARTNWLSRGVWAALLACMALGMFASL